MYGVESKSAGVQFKPRTRSRAFSKPDHLFYRVWNGLKLSVVMMDQYLLNYQGKNVGSKSSKLGRYDFSPFCVGGGGSPVCVRSILSFAKLELPRARIIHYDYDKQFEFYLESVGDKYLLVKSF